MDKEFADWLDRNRKPPAPKWPGWVVQVEDHAVERWRERYSHDDTEAARTTITRRMQRGLNQKYQVNEINPRRIRALSHPDGRQYRETDMRLIVGDMKFAYSRMGRSVRVYTCYPVR